MMHEAMRSYSVQSRLTVLILSVGELKFDSIGYGYDHLKSEQETQCPDPKALISYLDPEHISLFALLWHDKMRTMNLLTA